MRSLSFLIVFLLIGSTGGAQPLHPLEQRVIQVQKMPVSRSRDTTLACLYDSCARRWIFLGQTERASAYLRRFEAISQKYVWPYGEALLLYRKGHYQTVLGDAAKAKAYFLQALPRLNHLNHPNVLLATYTQMGASEIDRDWTDSTSLLTAIGYLQEGRNLSLKTPGRVFYLALCYQLGRAYLHLHRYADALHYLTESMKPTPPDSVMNMAFYHSLQFMICYAHLGDKQRGQQTLKRTQSFLPDLNTQEYYDYYAAMADIHLFEGAYARMLSDGNEMLIYAVRLKSPTKVLWAHRILFGANKSLKRSKPALQELEIIQQLEDSTVHQRSTVRLAELQLQYDTKRQEEAFAQVIIKSQKYQTRLLTGGIVLLLLLLGIIIYSNRRLRQKNRAIIAAQLKGQTLERHRVAADLHDNLGSTLSSLNFSLSALDTTKLSQPEQDLYTTLTLQLRQAYTDLRLLAHNLLPKEFEKQGLLAALRLLAQKINQQKSVQFTLSLPAQAVRFEPQVEFELYGICLELVNNILKHANASQAHIALTTENGQIRLLISDNGTGLPSQQTEGKGLQNIAARVASLGGTWVVESEPGQGVRHQIKVPIRKLITVA